MLPGSGLCVLVLVCGKKYSNMVPRQVQSNIFQHPSQNISLNMERCLDSAALDENGTAYLATTWAATNTKCLDFPDLPGYTCPTWGTYVMAVKQT